VTADDPYLIPGSDTLLNLPGFVDPERLAQFEADVTRARMIELDSQPLPGRWDLEHLQRIHRHIFQDVYPWAGMLRTVDISKDGHLFARPQFLVPAAHQTFVRLADHAYLRGLDHERFVAAAAELLGDINALHPFREGNGRAQRAYLAGLAQTAGWRIAWERLEPERNIAASRASHDGDNQLFRTLLAELTQPAEATLFSMPPHPDPERPGEATRESLGARANPATVALDASSPASAAARVRPIRSPRPSPGADVPTVRSSRPSPGDNVPTVRHEGPQGVRAPRSTPQRPDEGAREAAEQARRQAERHRGPAQSQ
jgi:cell filamentation protein